jgi:hypothetical protein
MRAAHTRTVQFWGTNKVVRLNTDVACPGCKLHHDRGTRHRGGPRDWNRERINQLGHRELCGDADGLLRDLDTLPATYSFADRLAMAVVRRGPCAEYRWLAPPSIETVEDHVLYVTPPHTKARLEVGIGLVIRSSGCEQVTSPHELIAGDEPIALMGLTGVWIDGIETIGSETEAEFLKRGAELVNELVGGRQSRKRGKR